MDELTDLYVGENYPEGTPPRYLRALGERNEAVRAFGRMTG